MDFKTRKEEGKRILYISTPRPAKNGSANDNECCYSLPSNQQRLLVKKSDEEIIRQSKLAEKIQSSIMNYGQMIAAVEEEEVDLDDPNSAFIRSEKMKSRLLRFASKCYDENDYKQAYYVFRKVKLNPDVVPVPFPSLLQTVEKFVNTSCIQYRGRNIPNFMDLRTVIEKWNTGNGNNVLTRLDIEKYCEIIMKLIITDIRKKRVKDLNVTLNKHLKAERNDAMLSDPAESDPSLAEKLMHNEQTKRKMDSLEESFISCITTSKRIRVKQREEQSSMEMPKTELPKAEEIVVKIEPMEF